MLEVLRCKGDKNIMKRACDGKLKRRAKVGLWNWVWRHPIWFSLSTLFGTGLLRFMQRVSHDGVGVFFISFLSLLVIWGGGSVVGMEFFKQGGVEGHNNRSCLTCDFAAQDWLKAESEQLSSVLSVSGISDFEVHYRVKSAESAQEKSMRKGVPVGALVDLYGMRVVVSDEDAAYRVMQVVNGQYGFEKGSFKDYIRYPKPSGYQSLHGIIKRSGQRVELQVRSREMHAYAEWEHAAYKDRVRVAA